MALSARFEQIIARHIGTQKAKELADALDAAYGPSGTDSLSDRGEQLLFNLLGKRDGSDFKRSADRLRTPCGNRCEQLLASKIGEVDAREVRGLFDLSYQAVTQAEWIAASSHDDAGEADVEDGPFPDVYLIVNVIDAHGLDRTDLLNSLAFGWSMRVYGSESGDVLVDITDDTGATILGNVVDGSFDRVLGDRLIIEFIEPE